MVLQNNVILRNGIPERMHLYDHSIEPRTITDPQTRRPVQKNVLSFRVDRLNGQAVDATLSTMAEKLAAKFQPYLADKSYTRYEVIITQTGEGFTRSWSVQFIPQG